MTHFRYDARISIPQRTNRDTALRVSSDVILHAAADLLAIREYPHQRGSILVTADWTPLLQQRASEREAARLPLSVTGTLHEREAPAFAELFCHDAFLMLNLAAPGDLSIALATASGSELLLDGTLFDYARAAALRNIWPPLATPSLREIVAWYDSLQLGTTQLATSGAAATLFNLLHLARSREIEELSLLRVAGRLEASFGDASRCMQAVTARFGAPPPEVEPLLALLFARRAALLNGAAAVIHPMHDESLDARLEEDEPLLLLDAVDLATSLVIASLLVDVVRRDGGLHALPGG